MVFLVRVLRLRGVHVIIENPAQSDLFLFPMLLRMLIVLAFYLAHGHMCAHREAA